MLHCLRHLVPSPILTILAMGNRCHLLFGRDAERPGVIEGTLLDLSFVWLRAANISADFLTFRILCISRRSLHLSSLVHFFLAGPVDNKGEPTFEASMSGSSDDVLLLRRGSILLAPWLNHKGGLNHRLWQGLVERIMSIVISTPG